MSRTTTGCPLRASGSGLVTTVSYPTCSDSLSRGLWKGCRAQLGLGASEISTSPALPPGGAGGSLLTRTPAPAGSAQRPCTIQVAAGSRKATCKRGLEVGGGSVPRPREVTLPLQGKHSR